MYISKQNFLTKKDGYFLNCYITTTGLLKIFGPLGIITISFNKLAINLSNLIIKSLYRRYLNMLWGKIMIICNLISFGYVLGLSIKGIGYKFKLKRIRINFLKLKKKQSYLKIKQKLFSKRKTRRRTCLIIKLGYCHKLFLKIPSDIIIRFLKYKKMIIFLSINPIKLFDFVNKIRKLRSINVYTGKGVRFINQKIRFKVGKQR